MGLEDLDFSEIEQVTPETREDRPIEQDKEAPFLAQVGRGQMDVVQGVGQVASDVVDRVKVFDKALDALNKSGSKNNLFSKSIVSAFIAINPGGILRDEKVSDYSKEVSEELKLYRKENPDLQGGRILGSIATPLTLVPGYKGKGLLEKMFTASVTGAGMSATQPVENVDEFWAEKGEQTLWGAGVSSAFPVGGNVLKAVGGWLDELAKPFTKSGIVRDVGKFLKETITENKDKIVKAIDKAVKSGDKRTVGQIIADATQGAGDDFGGMLVRLEKDLARESDSLKSLYSRQDIGRRKIIDSLAGTDDDFAAAVKRRGEDGARDYAQAFKASIAPDDELKQLLNNKFAKKALKDATDLAQAKGGASSAEVLHFAKLGLDKQITKKGDLALSTAERKIVGQVKANLVKWMESNNPAYAIARKNYRANSAPINKMEVGREIRDKFIGALDESKPGMFASAIKDSHKILKKITGDQRLKKLDDIFSPDEVAGLKGIVKELTLEKHAAKVAASSKPVIGKLSGDVSVSLPHILSRPIVIANHVLRKLGQDKTPEYKSVLSTLMRNPDKFIRIYGGSSKNVKTQHAIDIVKRLTAMTASQQPARVSAEDDVSEQDASINALDFADI